MTESQSKSDKLVVVQGLPTFPLAGPFQKKIELSNGITVTISQCGKRTIEILANISKETDELFEIFQTVEKLLMLFDGRFYPIEKLTFSLGDNDLPNKSGDYLHNRLGYYSSKDFCQHSYLTLLSFQDVLSNELYRKWVLLLEEMDISYQTLLYSISDNNMPVDINFAFLVELAEPFVELVKEKTSYFQSLSHGDRGPTLKMCVDNLIKIYGKDIFDRELKNNYDNFLETTVNSRVRIMHIKKKHKEYFDGKESVRYSMKFLLLYRKIIMTLLDIPYEEFKLQLQIAIEQINKW